MKGGSFVLRLPSSVQMRLAYANAPHNDYQRLSKADMRSILRPNGGTPISIALQPMV